MKTIDLLDKAKEKLGVNSDNELAIALSTGKAAISHYRKGIRKPDEYTCFRLAEILEVEPQAVISAVRAESETDPVKQQFWMSYAKRYGVALSPFIIAGTITLEMAGLSSPANTEISMKSGINDKPILCIMRNCIRLAKRAWKRLLGLRHGQKDKLEPHTNAVAWLGMVRQPLLGRP